MIFLGITGGSGSGKSYIVELLKSHPDAEKITWISQDDYYHSLSKIPLDVNSIPNFDLPESLDLDRLIHDLRTLKSNAEVRNLKYKFNQPNIPDVWLTYYPNPIIVIEGLFIQCTTELNEMFDKVIYVDCHEEIRKERRLRRDEGTRNGSIAYDANPYENHVLPAYRKYIEPYKSKADFIIDNSQNEIPDTNELMSWLTSVLK